MLWPQPGSAVTITYLVSLEDDGHGHQMAAVTRYGANRAWGNLSSEGTAQRASALVSVSLLLS